MSYLNLVSLISGIIIVFIIGMYFILTIDVVSDYDSPFYTNVEESVDLEIRQAVLDIGYDPSSIIGEVYARDMRTAYMDWYGRLLAEKVFYHRHPDETVPGTLTEQNYKPQKRRN